VVGKSGEVRAVFMGLTSESTLRGAIERALASPGK
jgi:hypothetical protein